MGSFVKRLSICLIVLISAGLNLSIVQQLQHIMNRYIQDSSGAEPQTDTTTMLQKTSKKMIEASVVGTTTAPQNRTITILLQFKGELGNHLSVIANARVTQILASKLYPHLSFQFIGQHQSREKDNRWMRVKEELRRCFPHLSDFIMDGGIHDPNFHSVSKQQAAWLNKRQTALLQNPREEGLALLQRMLTYQERGKAPKLIPVNATDGKYNYSLPFIVANGFYWSDGLKNTEMYNDLRDYFQFNESACCRLLPKSADTVYHHRNFNKIPSNHQLSILYSEVSPTEASELLFADIMKSSNNQSKSRIAIVSGSPNGLRNYAQAFTQRNPDVDTYIVNGQNGVQDFCFLMKSQKELVGRLHSTFIEWASFLGNSTLNRFYQIQPVEELVNQTLKSLLPSAEITENFEQGNRRFIFEKYFIPSSNSSTASV